MAHGESKVSFCDQANNGQRPVRILRGGDVLWQRLRYVLHRRFRRLSDAGLL